MVENVFNFGRPFLELRRGTMRLFMHNHLKLSIVGLEVLLPFETVVTPALLEEGYIFDLAVLSGTFFELECLVRIVGPSGKGGLAPGHGQLDAAATAVAAALHVFEGRGVVVDGLHELLDPDVFFFVVLFEAFESADPPFFDELIVAGELPGDFVGGVAGGEVVVCVHGAVADIFLLHEVLALELDGEEGGVEVELVDVLDVDDVDRTFGQPVVHLQGLQVSVEHLGDVGVIVQFASLDHQQPAIGRYSG